MTDDLLSGSIEAYDEADAASGMGAGGGVAAARARKEDSKKRAQAMPASPTMAPAPSAVDMLQLARSAAPTATAKRVAGLTRFDLGERVTLPDGSASMVSWSTGVGARDVRSSPAVGQGRFQPYAVVASQRHRLRSEPGR